MRGYTGWDLLIVALAAAITGGSWLTLADAAGPGTGVLIHTSDGTVTRSLSAAGRFTVIGDRGASVLEVSDGSIRFVSSPCSSKRCVLQGPIVTAGSFAACLPNRVSVEVAGERRFDSINH